jgi:hypothetical protein
MLLSGQGNGVPIGHGFGADFVSGHWIRQRVHIRKSASRAVNPKKRTALLSKGLKESLMLERSLEKQLVDLANAMTNPASMTSWITAKQVNDTTIHASIVPQAQNWLPTAF